MKMDSLNPSAGSLNARQMFLLVACALFLATIRSSAVGSWTGTFQADGHKFRQLLLLSEGHVLCLTDDDQTWYVYGEPSGVNLTTQMNYKRSAFGKALLRDGRMFVVGDENDGNGTTAEVFDPISGFFTTLTPPSGINFKDCPTIVLPDGRVLIWPGQGIASPPYPPNSSVIYTPTTNSPSVNDWLVTAPTSNNMNEASWVLLSDGSVVTVDQSGVGERYIPTLNQWIIDSTPPPVNLYGAGETGPGLLLPNGNAFFLGASGQTAIYIPSPLGGTNLGTWARGPNIPNGWVSCDAPASMMPNGKILCAIGSVAGNGTSPPPTAFCEFDYTDTNQSPYGSFYLTSSPRDPTIGSGFADNNGSYYFAFVNLPDGTILCSTYTDTLYIYQPDGTPLPAGKPVIQGVSWNGAAGLHLTGIQLNGISSGSAFGDENPTSSAYPLARFLDGSGNELFYGRTYNWSTAGIRTGSQIVTTEVDLGFQPGFLTGYFWDRSSVGFASVQVVANGIASDPYPFPVPGFVWVNFNVNTFTNIPLGTRAHPYTTLADGTYAVPSHGVIAIDSSTQPSSSLETMTISKPMTIISAYGPATIGH